MGSYYNIDTILTDAQKVPCTFEQSVPGLGYLDGNSGTNMKKGTLVDLPLWLGERLAGAQISGSSFATLDIPNALSQGVLNALKADPRTVDLRSLATHFYSLGARALELFEDEEEEMVGVLSETFKKRAAEIADQAHNPRGALGEGQEFLNGLDETERQRLQLVFRSAHDSAKAMRVWMGEMKKK
ncbi:MAG: DNA replication protein [Candelina mexicana]|nr:MAG: DNA replication protein [Candelina mexicana]